MQTATIKATGQKVTIIDFKVQTINYPKKSVTTSKFWVKDSTGAPVENKDTGCDFFTSDELEFDKPEAKPTHNISNGEELFLQAKHEARVENEDYQAAMEQSNFK